MKTLTLEAPAKINLTLDILGRRTDGYHDMRMVMQAVSLGDTVTVAEAAGGFSLLTEGISLPAGKVTLEQRAADAFFHRLGRPVPGLEVRLAKRVPAYAGLGGGSADVAAVLRCLRTLYAPDLPRQALEEIGLAVGSDVPFCVRGGTCLAEGRGEILTDLPPLPDCAIVLCKPDFGLPTPELFARLDGADLGPRPDTAAMAAALARGDLAAAAACLGNVFERVLTEEEGEEIRSIKEALLLGAAAFLMTGVWALNTQRDLADKVVRLHVLANSDTEEDQALKLLVRDAVLERATEILEQSADRAEAEIRLRESLPELEAIAEETVRANGYDYAVTAELEDTAFPTKEYDGFSLPAGEYLALRILIGEGAGQNWWCVVFPPLCTAASADVPETALAAGLTEDQVSLMTEEDGGYQLKFKAVELWERLKAALE